jgi:3'-phosphoadenosine 5'-phosphosulfate sulfotransferase (PAPS reductase)/FAD synthetase
MTTTKHIVGFSGGIDSQACARWVLNRYPAEDVILLNSDAGGNEHPLTTEHICWYSENVHPVTVVSPIAADLDGAGLGIREELGIRPRDVLTFDMLAKIKGRFPSPTARFCTEFLKIKPQKRWMLENLPLMGDYVRYTGVRRDESHRRKDTPISVWDPYYDCERVNPVADWTKQMCFAYCKAHGEKVNPLYMLGFPRVGCALCIMCCKEEIRLWAIRFPEMIDKIRQWEKSVGRTFFGPVVPGMAINWIDDVVAWSMTARGGRDLDPEVAYARPACESKYGLCE